MTQLDKETLDYLKSNIEREVRENVERRLFKTWTALAAAFLAGVGLVGTPWLISYLDGKVSKAVEVHVKEQASAPTARAKQLAEEAQTLAQSAREKITTALSEIELRRKLIDEGLSDMRTKAALAGEEVVRLRSEFAVRAKEIDSALKSARDRVGEIDDRATQLSDRLRNAVPDAGVLASLAVDVKSLVTEVKRLDDELRRVAQKAGAPGIVSESPEQRAQFAKLEQTATQRTQVVQANAPSTTVYVQFAGVSRDVIKELSLRLTQAGWKVPGEERLKSAIGLREVRCFYETDCESARQLRDQINAFLAEQYGSARYAVKINPLYAFSPKPRQGILEVWVELPNPS